MAVPVTACRGLADCTRDKVRDRQSAAWAPRNNRDIPRTRPAIARTPPRPTTCVLHQPPHREPAGARKIPGRCHAGEIGLPFAGAEHAARLPRAIVFDGEAGLPRKRARIEPQIFGAPRVQLLRDIRNVELFVIGNDENHPYIQCQRIVALARCAASHSRNNRSWIRARVRASNQAGVRRIIVPTDNFPVVRKRTRSLPRHRQNVKIAPMRIEVRFFGLLRDDPFLRAHHRESASSRRPSIVSPVSRLA